MFRFLGYILVSVADVLDVACATVDFVLSPLSKQNDLRNCPTPAHDIIPSLGSRHEDRGGRVMSEEDENHSSEARGSCRPQHSSRRCSVSQQRLPKGYSIQADHLRSCEFTRLGSRVYVDHAGATLYSEKQLEHAYKVQHT